MPEVDWDSFGTAPVAADLPKRKNPCKTRVFESAVAFNGESGIIQVEYCDVVDKCVFSAYFLIPQGFMDF